MLNVEEYDLRKGVFRVRCTVFQYIDGTESEPLTRTSNGNRRRITINLVADNGLALLRAAD